MRTFAGTRSWAPKQGRWDGKEDDGLRSRVATVVTGLSRKPLEIEPGLRHLCALTGVPSAEGLPAAIRCLYPWNREEGAQLAQAVEVALSQVSSARRRFEQLFPS